MQLKIQIDARPKTPMKPRSTTVISTFLPSSLNTEKFVKITNSFLTINSRKFKRLVSISRFSVLIENRLMNFITMLELEKLSTWSNRNPISETLQILSIDVKWILLCKEWQFRMKNRSSSLKRYRLSTKRIFKSGIMKGRKKVMKNRHQQMQVLISWMLCFTGMSLFILFMIVVAGPSLQLSQTYTLINAHSLGM